MLIGSQLTLRLPDPILRIGVAVILAASGVSLLRSRVAELAGAAVAVVAMWL